MDIQEVAIYLQALQEVSRELSCTFSYTKISECQELGGPLFLASVSLVKEVDGIQKRFATTALFFGDEQASLNFVIGDHRGMRLDTVGRKPADLNDDKFREMYTDEGKPNWQGACMFLSMNVFANVDEVRKDEMEQRMHKIIERLCAET
jgi:hypothetical protein